MFTNKPPGKIQFALLVFLTLQFTEVLNVRPFYWFGDSFFSVSSGSQSYIKCKFFVVFSASGVELQATTVWCVMAE